SGTRSRPWDRTAGPGRRPPWPSAGDPTGPTRFSTCGHRLTGPRPRASLHKVPGVSLVDQLRLEHPIVQAGMGGGIAGGLLAGSVSAAGALGTVGILPPDSMRKELSHARELAEAKPLAANLLVP